MLFTFQPPLAPYGPPSLQEADLLEVERLEKEQSILERRRELLLLLGGGFQT